MQKYNKTSKKAYYGTLFTCFLALAIMAGAGSYFSKANKKTPKENMEINEQQIKQETVPQSPEQSSQEQIEEPETASVSLNQNAQPEVTAVESETEVNKIEAPQQTALEVPQQTASEEPTEPVLLDQEEEDGYIQVGNFEDDAVFSWPVDGDIVMEYAADTAIYDPTLEQFRTNNSISISAAEGAQVTASGNGIIEQVGYNPEDGNFVVINHNNGWQTTYSQLSDDLMVKKGEKVNVGQVLGTVAQPTKYGVALGNHIDFEVSRNGESINPITALAEK